MRTVLTSIFAVSLGLAVVGCNRAADEQRKADEARAEADRKAAEVSQDSQQRINSAQAEADEKIAEANASFLKMREDYRHDMTQKLVELDKDIAELEAKAKSATGKAKAKIESNLPSIRQMRDDFVRDYRGVEAASASTWDATKDRLNKSWDELEKAVDRAD
jgi:hypothetical protein